MSLAFSYEVCELLIEWEGSTAAAFFTTYELLKGTVLPQLFPALNTKEWAPLLHMLSASGGEIVSSPTSLFSASNFDGTDCGFSFVI